MTGVQAYFSVSPGNEEDPVPPFYLISKTSGQSWHGMGVRFQVTKHPQDQKSKQAEGGTLNSAPDGVFYNP